MVNYKLEFILWDLLKSGLEFLVIYQMIFSFGYSHLKIISKVFVFLRSLWSFVNIGMLIWLVYIWVPTDFLIYLLSFFKELVGIYLMSLQVARQELWSSMYLLVFFFVQCTEYISGSSSPLKLQRKFSIIFLTGNSDMTHLLFIDYSVDIIIFLCFFPLGDLI